MLPCGAGKTIVGAAALARGGAKTLILVTNTVSARQWRRELLARTSLSEEDIGEYSGERKEIRPVTIATYQVMVTRRKRFVHLEQDWGLSSTTRSACCRHRCSRQAGPRPPRSRDGGRRLQSPSCAPWTVSAKSSNDEERPSERAAGRRPSGRGGRRRRAHAGHRRTSSTRWRRLHVPLITGDVGPRRPSSARRGRCWWSPGGQLLHRPARRHGGRAGGGHLRQPPCQRRPHPAPKADRAYTVGHQRPGTPPTASARRAGLRRWSVPRRRPGHAVNPSCRLSSMRQISLLVSKQGVEHQRLGKEGSSRVSTIRALAELLDHLVSAKLERRASSAGRKVLEWRTARRRGTNRPGAVAPGVPGCVPRTPPCAEQRHHWPEDARGSARGAAAPGRGPGAGTQPL